jgi:hypothetical protein
MKDVYQILEQKEADLTRVRRELESLQVVASLLTDETREEPAKKPTSGEKPPLDEDSEATGTKGLFSSVASTRSGFWTRK